MKYIFSYQYIDVRGINNIQYFTLEMCHNLSICSPIFTNLFTVSEPQCLVPRSLSKMLIVLACLQTQSLRQGLSANTLFGRCSPRALRRRDMGSEAGQKEKQCKVKHYPTAADSL